MAAKPFQLHDISNREELFGREKLIEHLFVNASMRLNVPIIGARRFGKTCLFKTVEKIIKKDGDLGLYPIYLDFKDSAIQGTQLSYSYMLSCLISSLYVDGLFNEVMRFGATEIRPSDDWTEVSEQFQNLSIPRTQSLLEKVIKWFSELMEKAILFIIDEYEYLFKYALETPLAFSKIRTMSSDINSEGDKYFCFWIAGATPWDELIAAVPGSGEANTVTSPLFVTPIDKVAFQKMWDYECSKIEDSQKAEIMRSYCEFAYENSGGVPFYGKDLIGSFIYRNNSMPDFSICNTFFKELTAKAMSSGEYRILKSVALLPQKIEKSVSRTNLVNKGLVKVDGKEKMSIPFQFLKEFILAEMNDIKAARPQKNETETLVRGCMDLIETINNQMANYGKNAIFKPVNDGSSMENDLRTPCYNKDQFSDFASALYKTYFERAKDGRNEVKNLHWSFFSNSDFAKCTDIARHSFGGGHEMDNFIKRDGQFSKDDMLLLLTGSVNEPFSQDEWYRLQVEFLKLFKTELDRMRTYLRENIRR